MACRQMKFSPRRLSNSSQTVTQILLRDIENKIWEAVKTDMDGDGIVTDWSATLGDVYTNRTYYAVGVSHINLINNMDVLDFIVALIVGDSTPPSDSVILTEKERNINA